jgi:hypothetical protein
MKRALLVALLAACQAGASDGYPSRPGGTGPILVGPGTTRDAGIGDGGLGDAVDGDAGVSITGRVCLISDMRKLTTCKDTGAAGLTVSLGTGQGTTSADGTFRLVAPLGAGFTWHVTGGQIITSVMPFGTDNTIPVLIDATYNDLLVNNDNPLLDEDHGSVVVRVVSGTAAVAGVTATVSPAADSLTYYDNGAPNSSTVWNTNATQAFGVVWVPNAPLPTTQLPGPTTIKLTRVDGATVRTANATATVESRSITFVTQTLP